jgi:glutaredoxin
MANSSSPRSSGLTNNVVLYTRRGCHLCEDALRLLEHHGLAPRCADIDDDPVLKERFNTCVPVIEINGQIRFRGTVHPVLLKRIIRQELSAE